MPRLPLPCACFFARPATRKHAGLRILALATAVIPAAANATTVGATVPFVSYEAEAGVLAGGASVRALAQPATTAWDTPELEASGRTFVELNAPL